MIAFAFLLAFGFGNLAMLGWLAAAAAPLLIHLWSRHRFREVDWAALQFLLAAMRKNARRLQLQQWLLLAVRTLLILLVVLAVAEPYGSALVVSGSGSVPAHKVIVLDSTFSMAYREGAIDHFRRAKELAAELVHNSSSGDTFTIIQLARPSRIVVDRNVIDSRAVAERILSLPQTQTGAEFSGAIDLVSDALARNARDPRGRQRQQVFFFTDLQRTTWAPNSQAGPGKGTSFLGDRLASLAKMAELMVVDVGTPRATNLAAVQLAVDASYVTIGSDVPISARLHQFGDQPRDDCVVELLVDGQIVGEQKVDVPAGGESRVDFTHRFSSPGSHSLAIRAAGDRLAIDDSRYLVAPVRDRVRVLCVAGREGAAKYIANALNPDPSVVAAIEPIIVTGGELEEIEFDKFDCIFLCNVPQLTENDAVRLTRYAADGGGIVIFLGDRVIADQYNALAVNGPAETTAGGSSSTPNVSTDVNSPIRESTALLPARLGPIAAANTFGIDPLDYRHPIVAPFRGRERAGLLTTPIRRYYHLQLSANRPDVTVAAALAGGDPLIVVAPVGLGHVILVATDGSLTSVDQATGEPWTSWPTWPSFLPIVREMLAYATSGQQGQWQHLVGTPLGGTLAANDPSDGATLQITRPDGQSDRLLVRHTPEGSKWSYDQTGTSGIYVLRGSSPGEPTLFAVNVDPAESDLTRADAKSLPPELQIRTTWQEANPAIAAQFSTSSQWNLPLLWGALGLLFAESYLAWRFGRGVA